MKLSLAVTQQRRPAFTLIELLVTVSLIATVAAMFLVAYRSAATEASSVRTASTIRKISEVLMSRMQEYEYFRTEPLAADATVTPSAATGYRFPTSRIPGNAVPILPQSDPKFESATVLLERARLLSLRQTIVQEMPDHPDDLKWTSGWFTGGNVEQHLQYWLSNSHLLPTGLTAPPRGPIFSVINISTRTRNLIKRLSTYDTAAGMFVPIPGWETRNANAELLYLVVEDSSINGSSALELFGKSEIRDTDGDGLNEIVDAFGTPIRWIRWPSGTDMSLRSHPDLLDPALLGSDVQGDPMDRNKSDPGYAPYSDPALRNLIGLRPLVISPGPDKRFGIRMQLDSPNPVGSGPTLQSFSLGDIPAGTGAAPTIYLPYASFPAAVADPWYPRNDQSLRLGYLRPSSFTRGYNAAIDPDPQSELYDLAVDAVDNISNLETGGSAL